MKIAIASDHGGFDLKEQLKEYYAGKGIKLDDLGTYSSESCDYPDIAKAMCDRILSGEAETGFRRPDHDFCRGCPADGYLFADGF